jgi:hypothetical protein
MPDLAFPLVGRLGLTSPPSPVLCSATTTICPSRYPMLSLGHRYLVSTTRCLCPLFKLVWNRSSSPDAGAVCSTGSPLSSGFARQETNGSPKFPGYPFEYMPRSSTPVVSSALALAHSGLLPSTRMTVSAFSPKKRVIIQCPQLYKFRGSITRPTPSLTLASDVRHRIYPQGSLPACWLDFGWTGLSPVG